jgi:hypothetical protein
VHRSGNSLDLHGENVCAEWRQDTQKLVVAVSDPDCLNETKSNVPIIRSRQVKVISFITRF